METTDIKRYLPTIDYRYNGATETVTAVMDEHPQGEWVRWEDVEKLLQKQEDNYAYDVQWLDARIQRLMDK